MDDIIAKIRFIVRAEALLLRLHIRRAAQQAVLIAVGIVAVLLAVGMLNLSAYLFLAAEFGPPVAALLQAIANGVLALVVFVIAARLGLGREAETAKEVRELGMEQLSADARRLERELVQIRTDVAHMRSALSALRHGDVMGLSILGPILKSVSGALRSDKETSETREPD